MARSAKRERNAAVLPVGIPPPFAKASDRLQPFLDLLNPERVYIVHLDKLAWDFKRQIFAVPVLMNILIVVGLLWRWYTIIPHYLELTLILTKNHNPALTGITATFAEKAWLTLRRALMFVIDFILISVIMPWPISFFLEQPANPVKWRRKVRFQDVEIIVRESRRWGNAELLGGAKKGEESPYFKARVIPAVERRLLQEKTGYSMMGKDWDLDFADMINAAELVNRKDLTYNDFEATVLVYDKDLGWLSWVVYQSEDANDEADRAKLVAFKVSTMMMVRGMTIANMKQNRLIMMGKENLFFRWIEIVQYEVSRPGGLARSRHNEVVEKAREVFTAQGIEFDDFVDSVGGIAAFPGLEQAES